MSRVSSGIKYKCFKVYGCILSNLHLSDRKNNCEQQLRIIFSICHVLKKNHSFLFKIQGKFQSYI